MSTEGQDIGGTRTSHHPIPVRWRDCDALGHVHHSVYLIYLEEGRDAFFRRTLGLEDPMYVVVRIELNFRREVRTGTPEVRSVTAVQQVGRSSLTLHEQLLHVDGAVAAESLTTLVWWDSDKGCPRPFSTAERRKLGF
jgi:YbgC/YbaW family acyl-CoA thioester hydrolase